MTEVMMRGYANMDVKRVAISSKRQITIPLKFFKMMGFDKEAECIVRGNELVLRPVKENTGGEFAEQILADLILKGYSGNELLIEFKKAQKQIRPAVEAMIRDADLAAKGETEFYSYQDVFGTEDDE